MTPKDPLFDLIKSLSASEKRYFKRFATLQGDQDYDYLDLFQVMDKLSTYQESHLVQRLKNPIFAKNLSSGKNYLYQLILKSLRAYHARHKATFQAYDLIKDVHILKEKNLVGQANKRLQKAKKLTTKYQLNLPHLELLLLERNLIRTYRQKQSSELIADNQHHSKLCLEQISSRVAMVNLYDDVYMMIRNKMDMSDPDGSIRQLLEAFSTQAGLEHLSFDVRMTYHLLWSHYYLAIKKNINDARLHLGYILDGFDDAPQFIKEYTNRYVSVVNNYLNLLALQKNYHPFASLIKRLETLQVNSDYLKIKIFQSTTSLKLIALLGQKDFTQAAIELPDIIQAYRRHAKQLHPAFALEIQQNICWLYLHLQRYEAALDWCNQLTRYQKQDIRQDIQSLGKGLQLVLHFELGNESLAESLAKSLSRAYPYHKEDQFNKTLGKIMAKILQSPREDRPPLWRQLQTAFSACDPQTNGLEEWRYWVAGKG